MNGREKKFPEKGLTNLMLKTIFIKLPGDLEIISTNNIKKREERDNG